MRNAIVSFAAVAATVTLVGSAHAGLLAKDSYLTGTDPTAGQYQDGVSLKNQPSTLVNTGFANGGYTGGSGTSNFTATSGGLNSAAAQSDSTSGKVNWISAPADSIARSNARSLSGVPSGVTSGTYWITHVVNRGNLVSPVNGGFVLTGFGNAVVPLAGAEGGTLAGLYVGFAHTSDANNFGNLVIRYRDTSGTNTSADTVLVDGSTTSTLNTSYTVVAKVDINAGGGSADKVTYWLNPTNGSSEDTLTSTAASTGSFDSYAFQSSSDFARLNYYAYNYNGTAFFDEPRLSTDLGGLGLAVPEPATLAAVAGAGLVMLRRRRRA